MEEQQGKNTREPSRIEVGKHTSILGIVYDDPKTEIWQQHMGTAEREAAPVTREQIEAAGGEIADEGVIADTQADELRRYGVSVDAFPPEARGEIIDEIDEESAE